MISESELRRKRALVGLLAIGCTVVAAGLLTAGASNGFASALLRVGLLLGAFWLALPTKDRSAAWAQVSPWTLVAVVIVVLILSKFKFILPLVIVGVLIGWFVRPRRGRSK